MKPIKFFKILSLCSSLCLILACDDLNNPSTPQDPPKPSPQDPPKPSPQDPPKPTPENPTITVATYNVHNLFDNICDSGQCHATSYEKILTPKQHEEKLKTVAKAINKLNADFLCLQEIEKEESFDELRKLLPQYNLHEFGEIGREASVDVAILAKAKSLKSIKHRENSNLLQSDGTYKKLSRELIQADIVLENNDRKLTLFTTHFVSKASDPQGPRRLAEAKYTHEIMENYRKQNPDTLIILCGDLNDTPKSEPIKALVDDKIWKLSTRDLEESKTYTWKYHALDHIIYNMTEQLPYQFKSSERVCNGINGGTGLGDSDHCALTATFEILNKK